MKLLFCAIAGRGVGYGHLNRCLSIAECARIHGLEAVFLVRRQGYAAIDAAWPSVILDLSFVGEAARTIAILDVAHPSVFSRLSDLDALLQTVGKLAHRLVAIDSLGRHSFAAALPAIPVDAVVIPYVGGAAFSGTSATMLVGPEYAVLSPDYANIPTRRINETA
ncbi:MAG: hypothetical protein HOI25_02815, partial [Proteobacteria bacterium]|nr:hypothetical protein [Pseudomonadota bacterium]